MLALLDHIVDKAREQEVFSREDVPTEERVWAAFLYHAGLSYRKVGLALGHSHEAVHQWYHQLSELFDPEPDRHRTVAVDETKVAVEDLAVYVWAAIDVDTFEVIHVEVSPGRSELDALLFLETVLERCRGEPVVLADRGPWYNWPLDDLDLPCQSRRETWGERSLVEAWFFVFKYHTMQFFDRFPYRSTWQSADRWVKAFATLHDALR
jgi:putative transposase